MNMKKVVSVLLATGMTAGLLAGCGGNNTGNGGSSASDGSGASGAAAPASGVKISLLNSKGGSLVDPLNEMAEAYKKETGVEIEIMNTPDGGSPFEKISSLYNSGNPPTISMLDTTDVITLANEKAVDLSDEKWVADADKMATRINGKIYSFPFCVEGRGLLYNKTAIENTLGETFDPSAIKTMDDFKAICERLVEKGMKGPVILMKEDWSLGAHYLQLVYETQGGGTSEDINAYLEKMKAGEVDLMGDARFTEYMDAFDTLASYNYKKVVDGDPMGGDNLQDALNFAEGSAAFWFNGNWGWADMKDYAEEGTEFGMMPMFISTGADDFANTSIQALGSKQLMIDKEKATPEQQQAAKDFINWLVYNEEGQKQLVDGLNLIPACKNNTLEPSDPLSADVKAFADSGKTFAGAIVPGDHWKILGISMQKYLGGQIDRAELAKQIQDYWINQK